MKKILAILAVGVFLVATVGSVYAVEVFQAKTELRQYNQAKAYPGYTTWANGGYGWLIDMDGNLVHTWEDGSFKLLANGNNYGNIFEMDWDGNYVYGPWQVPEDRPDIERVHHDSWKIFNALLNKYTYISIFYFTATNEEIWAAGGDPSIDYVADGRNTRQDGMLEVDPDTNEIIWEWKFMDHTVQDQNAAWANFGVVADSPGKNDVFWRTDQATNRGQDAGIVADWHHCNSLNYDQESGHVAINAKHWSEFYVIDHQGTFVPQDFEASRALAASDAGDFIYRFGNPSAYQQGDAPGFLSEGHQQMYGSHNIQWIKDTAYEGGPELPGAGNFLIFSNGCYKPTGFRSEILEINPRIFQLEDGELEEMEFGYINPPLAGYDPNATSNQVVWDYASVQENSFYSSYISSTQRLPNGNTLNDAGAFGHFFEVTQDGEVVWEYISPVTRGGDAISVLTDADGRRTNSTFRAMRWGPDHPAFIGKDLTPMGPITNNFFGGAMERLQASTAIQDRSFGDLYDPDDPYYPY